MRATALPCPAHVAPCGTARTHLDPHAAHAQVRPQRHRVRADALRRAARPHHSRRAAAAAAAAAAAPPSPRCAAGGAGAAAVAVAAAASAASTAQPLGELRGRTCGGRQVAISGAGPVRRMDAGHVVGVHVRVRVKGMALNTSQSSLCALPLCHIPHAPAHWPPRLSQYRQPHWRPCNRCAFHTTRQTP